VENVEALNQRYSEGVTPENNAAVPFWQALGPQPLDEEIRQEYFDRLGLSLAEERDYFFIDLEAFVKEYQAELEDYPDYADDIVVLLCA